MTKLQDCRNRCASLRCARSRSAVGAEWLYWVHYKLRLPRLMPFTGCEAGSHRRVKTIAAWQKHTGEPPCACWTQWVTCAEPRSEEHTSELQSRPHLVCR